MLPRLPYAAVLIALLLTQPQLRTRRMLLRTSAGAVGLVAFAGASVLAVAVLGARPAAAAATLSAMNALVGSINALPQPVRLLRDRAQDMSGLSIARWRLGAPGACASWTSYGWLGHQPAVWVGAAFGTTCAVLMCGILGGRTAQTAGPRRLASRPSPRQASRPVRASSPPDRRRLASAVWPTCRVPPASTFSSRATSACLMSRAR